MKGAGVYVRKKGIAVRHFDSSLCYVQCTVQYTVHCRVYTVQCTLYSAVFDKIYACGVSMHSLR
jgi:hypothetical protein